MREAGAGSGGGRQLTGSDEAVGGREAVGRMAILVGRGAWARAQAQRPEERALGSAGRRQSNMSLPSGPLAGG